MTLLLIERSPNHIHSAHGAQRFARALIGSRKTLCCFYWLIDCALAHWFQKCIHVHSKYCSKLVKNAKNLRELASSGGFSHFWPTCNNICYVCLFVCYSCGTPESPLPLNPGQGSDSPGETNRNIPYKLEWVCELFWKDMDLILDFLFLKWNFFFLTYQLICPAEDYTFTI